MISISLDMAIVSIQKISNKLYGPLLWCLELDRLLYEKIAALSFQNDSFMFQVCNMTMSKSWHIFNFWVNYYFNSTQSWSDNVIIKGYALCLHEQLKWSKVEVGPLGVLVTWSTTSCLPEHWMQPNPEKWFKFDFYLVCLPIPSLLHTFSHHILSQCQHVCPFTVTWTSTWLQRPWL